MKQVLAILCVLVLSACSGKFVGFSFVQDRRDSATITVDERIMKSAYMALQQLDDIKNHAHFTVTSYNTKVLVTGQVEAEDIREKIISNIRIISGVKLVHDELLIAPISTIESRSEDLLLTTKVTDKLDGLSSFDASYVKVVTENKVVYLMGMVSETEGDVATKVVQQVEGVKKIIVVFEYIELSKQ